MARIAPTRISTVLLDIDGTVVDAKNCYNSRLKNEIGELVRDGVCVGVSTNRALKSSMGIYKELGLNGPILFEDGAAIYLPLKNKRVNLITNVVKLNSAKALVVEAINSGKLAFELKMDDVVFKLNDEKEYSISVHIRKNDGTRCDYLVSQIVPAVESILANFTNLITYDTGRGNFLVRYVDSGKGVGVEYMVRKGLINGEETIIIGDGDNDVLAFRMIQMHGGLAGVVGNATDRAKAFADIYSSSEYSEGVMEILAKVKLLNSEVLGGVERA
ncbi:MAG: HAD family phosphatase [Candidatus Micrarchaeota archaeon]|nr:HAD family phosphatase [Candidatus Micrarchaeota archaeon]MDE1847712.1 HAD family phosphatase [Candidatus Micrarchaeota archaeon]MDE1864141.1 HAD family phosphatase [Candidatus Micrarchaeota archaeon]